MRRIRWWILALSLVLSSCDGSRSPFRLLDPFGPWRLSPPVFGLADSVFTDQQLIAAVYSSYEGPPGFYAEPATTIAPYYVNTASIAPPCCREPVWRELATDDPAQARAWADSSVAYSNHVAPLDTTAFVTEKYIEFRPGPVVSPNQGVAMRAHRLAYLDRWARDRLHPDSLEGRLNARPIDAAAARKVAEYLWYVDHRQIHGEKALSSFGRDEGNVLVHVVFQTRLVMGDYDMRDVISLIRSEYRVSRTTGDIVRRELLVRTVPGKSR